MSQTPSPSVSTKQLPAQSYPSAAAGSLQPQPKSSAVPAQSPLQSTVAVQLPSQSKFSAANVQEPSSVSAASL